MSFIGGIFNAINITYLVVQKTNTEQILSIFSLLFGIFGHISIYSEARRPHQQQRESLSQIMTYSCIFSFVNILFTVIYLIKQQIVLWNILISLIPYGFQNYLLYTINNNFLLYERLGNQIKNLKIEEKMGKKSLESQKKDYQRSVDLKISVIQIFSLIGFIYNFSSIAWLLQQEYTTESIILTIVMLKGIFLYIQLSVEARKPEPIRQISMYSCQIYAGLFAFIKLFSIIYFCMLKDKIYISLLFSITPYFI